MARAHDVRIVNICLVCNFPFYYAITMWSRLTQWAGNQKPPTYIKQKNCPEKAKIWFSCFEDYISPFILLGNKKLIHILRFGHRVQIQQRKRNAVPLLEFRTFLMHHECVHFYPFFCVLKNESFLVSFHGVNWLDFVKNVLNFFLVLHCLSLSLFVLLLG